MLKISQDLLIGVIKNLYRVRFSFGGRGHSLMIPYGLDIPIVSITTHDKQKFFMNDIKYNNCNLEMDQISSESFLNFVKDLDKKIAAQPNSNVEYKKNGYKLWKNFVRI